MEKPSETGPEDWVRGQLKEHVGHLVKNGVVTRQLRATVAWELPQRLCLSRAGSHEDEKVAYWVMSGPFGIDHIERKLAETPRLAVRHFALKLQLRAARLDETKATGETDMSKVAQELERNASLLYALTEDDRHWLS